MIGKGGVDGLAALVGEGTILNQKAVVILGQVDTLVIQTDKAVDELAVHEGIAGIHPTTRDPIDPVLVIVGIGSLGLAAHKPHILKTVVCQSTSQSNHNGIIL